MSQGKVISLRTDVYKITDASLEVLLAELELKYAEIVASLTEKEALIWGRRYPRRGVGLTLESIGAELGLTRQRISQILQRIKRKLMHPSRSDSLLGQFVLVSEKAATLGISYDELIRLIVQRSAGLRFHLVTVLCRASYNIFDNRLGAVDE